LREIKRVVKLVNERARVVENVEKLAEIQQRFDPREDIDLVEHKRFLVTEMDVVLERSGKVRVVAMARPSDRHAPPALTSPRRLWDRRMPSPSCCSTTWLW
jgi:hypothetical protein